MHLNRRDFIRECALALSVSALPLIGAEAGKPSAWPIGCLNRPWINDKQKWTYDMALDGMKAAGYKFTGLLTRRPEEPFIAASTTREYRERLRDRIVQRGLKVLMAAAHTRNEAALADQIRDIRQQIDNAQFLGAGFLLTFGVGKKDLYPTYCKVMKDAAAYAQERGLKIVLKPHGGSTAAAEEIKTCLQDVGHPHFKVWFDAGNIVYYTGKDPAEELKAIAEHVTGFCAKDCDKQKGTVLLNLGDGVVNFHKVFAVLKEAGFNGPVMLECCAPGSTPENVTEHARKNRVFLQELFAKL